MGRKVGDSDGRGRSWRHGRLGLRLEEALEGFLW